MLKSGHSGFNRGSFAEDLMSTKDEFINQIVRDFGTESLWVKAKLKEIETNQGNEEMHEPSQLEYYSWRSKNWLAAECVSLFRSLETEQRYTKQLELSIKGYIEKIQELEKQILDRTYE